MAETVGVQGDIFWLDQGKVRNFILYIEWELCK